MIFDPSEPVIDMEQFPKQDWSHPVYATGDAELTERTYTYPLICQKPGEKALQCNSMSILIMQETQ